MIEVLDCFVESFESGEQEFLQNSLVNLNTLLELPFTNYTQSPACNFTVGYTVTLIEKPFLSADQPDFVK